MRRHGLQIGINFKIEHSKRETCRSNNGNVCGVVELLVHNRAVVFPSWGLEELQLDQVLGVEWLASARVHLVPLDEGHNVHQVKDIALIITIGVFKRLQAESTVVKGQPFIVDLKKKGRLNNGCFYELVRYLFWVYLSVAFEATKEILHLLGGEP